jgi:hypothetical protein
MTVKKAAVESVGKRCSTWWKRNQLSEKGIDLWDKYVYKQVEFSKNFL